MLRSTIEQREEDVVQLVHNKPLVIERVVLSEAANYVDIIKSDINKSFNLTKEYPIRIKLYTIESINDKFLSF